MPIEFAERIRRMPVYPLAAGYDLGARCSDARLERVVLRAAPRGGRGCRLACSAASTGIRTRPTCHCAERSPTDTGSRPSGSLWATGRATSCSPPARRCSSRAPRSCTHGRHSACIRTSRLLLARARSRCRSTHEDRHDLDAIATEVTVATRLVLVCNPNNPTSTALGLDEIDAFMRRIPAHVAVILDEAYCEFSLTLGDTYASLEMLRKYPNLVLLRTFSKVYGLAALRAGYALCGAEDFRVAVDQVRQPFYLNAAAQAAAVEALKHQDEVERRVAETIAARLELVDPGAALGLWVARVGRELHLAAPARDGRGGRRGLGVARPRGARPCRRRARARPVAPGHAGDRRRERAVRATRSRRCLVVARLGKTTTLGDGASGRTTPR